MRFKVIFVLLFLFLFSGCNKEVERFEEDGYITSNTFLELLKEESVCIPSNVDNVKLTRQLMCFILSYSINNTEFLKIKYIPDEIVTEGGKKSRYFKKLFQGREKTEDNVILLQMRNAEKMYIQTQYMRDDRTISFYIYGNSVGNQRFEKLLKDYNRIDDEYKEAVLEACHLGYVDVFYGDEVYEVLFKPQDKVTLSYAKKVIHNLVYSKSPSPVDCIKIDYWENDEFDNHSYDYVNLCIGNVPCLVISKELEKVTEKEDKLYFTVGLNNISFSLWYNCRQFGMLEIPVEGEPINIEFTTADTVNRETRIKAASILLCKSFRESFIKWVNDNVDARVSCSKTFGEVNASFFLQDNSVCVISLR